MNPATVGLIVEVLPVLTDALQSLLTIFSTGHASPAQAESLGMHSARLDAVAKSISAAAEAAVATPVPESHK